MFLIDYHTHSQLSMDSEAPLAEMAKAASKAGLSELCTTDHFDMLSEDGKRNAPFSWEPNIAQYYEVLAHHDSPLTIRLGLELGGAPIDPNQAKRIYARSEADFIIGSLHNFSENVHGGIDFYYFLFKSLQDCYEVLDDYFGTMVILSSMPDTYDVLGHIIYPFRYMQRDGQDPKLEHYQEQLDCILKNVISNGRGIEINTYNGKTISDWLPVLRRYKELGGEILTTGSDAHYPENVAKGMAEATKMASECGFQYLTTFHRHQPEFHKIDL